MESTATGGWCFLHRCYTHTPGTCLTILFFVVSDFSLPLLWNGNGIVFRTYWKVLSKALDLVLNQPGLHEYFISLHCLEEINLHFEKSQAIDFATPMSAFLQQNPDMPSP